MGGIANLTFTGALTILSRSLYRPLTPLTLTRICIYHIQKSSSCHTENKICVPYKIGRLMLFTEITIVDYEKHNKHINTVHVKTDLLNCRNARSGTNTTTV
jgi:hypothetical protein